MNRSGRLMEFNESFPVLFRADPDSVNRFQGSLFQSPDPCGIILENGREPNLP
jgi:hypothetical protein